MYYDLGDGILIPRNQEQQEEPEPKPRNNKIIKKRKEKSPLDLVVEEIISTKKLGSFKIEDVPEEDFIRLAKEKEKEWNNDNINTALYDNELDLFQLLTSIQYAYEYEQGQKQKYYSVKKSKSGNSETHSIYYDEFISAEDRIKEGYFTVDEKERIAEKIFPLSQSVLRKFVASDNSDGGQYCSDDIKDAINFGITKALNSYCSLSPSTKVSFSSWAYACMNNACIDVVRQYSKGKYSGVSLVSYDADDGSVESNICHKEIEEKMSEDNENDKDIDTITKNVGRKEFIKKVFAEMFNFGKKSYIKQQIVIMECYFGIKNNRNMTFSEISTMLNMDFYKVKSVYEEGMNNFVKAVNKLGYDSDKVAELFYS